MNVLRRSSSLAISILAPLLTIGLVTIGLLTIGLGRASFAQSPALPAQLISLAEAHAIMEGAIAYAQEKNLRLGEGRVGRWSFRYYSACRNGAFFRQTNRGQ